MSDQQQRDDTIRHPGSGSGSSPEGAGARVLHAKYLDWCSAQVADHFLALTPEEIYELAERATQAETEAGGRSLSSSAGGGSIGTVAPDALASYREMVARVTSVLADQLDLPDFEAWLEFYRADPDAVEARLLGFWREES